MSPNEAALLHQRLRNLSPRSAQALTLRLIDGWERSRCAEFYGISAEAFDLMLLRAARELDGSPPIASYDEELTQARTLARALENATELLALAPRLCSLREHASTLRELEIQAAQAELTSPAFRRETWLRRLLVVLILALSAYFYVTQKHPPSGPSRPGFDRFQRR